MHSRLRRILLALSALAAAALLASCGGGGNDEDAKALLERSFQKQIDSADMTIDLQFKADGVEQLKDPVRVKVTGPFQSNGKDKLPDLDLEMSLAGGGQSFTAGLTATDNNAWVNFRGTDYEVGEDAVRAAQENQRKSGNRSLSQLGLNPADWLEDASEEGDETVGGAETIHVSSGIDLDKMLDDLNSFVDKAPLGGQRPSKLTDQQKDQIKDVVKDPKFDVYVGKDDEILRRLSTDMKFEVPEDDRSKVGGLEGGTLSFTVEFANIGSPKKVEAPSDAKPLAELQQQITGGLGGLGGLGGAGGSGGSGTTPSPGSGGTSTPGANNFKKYSDCVAKAKPTDADAIQKCADLLN